jgi:hypothetical protein
MFKFGCWSTIAAAVIHLVGHIAWQRPPANETEQRLFDLATSYSFTMSDGRSRTMIDFLDGFSLDFAVLLAAMGAIGLIVARRGTSDVVLMSYVARASAVASVVLLGIALTKFSVLAAFPIAVMATCYLVASVESPVPEEENEE